MSRTEDYGTTERMGRGKVVKRTADVTSGGMEVSQCAEDLWATYPRFLADIGLLKPEELDAAESYAALYDRTHTRYGGTGNGEGDPYTRWINITREIGPDRRKTMDGLIHSTPPSSPITEAEILDAEHVLSYLEANGVAEDIKPAVDALRILSERRAMQIAVINVHSITFRMSKIRICDALLCTAEAMRKFTE